LTPVHEKRCATMKRWRQNNRSQVNAYSKAWKKANPQYAQLWGAYVRDRRRHGRCAERMDLPTWKRVRAAFGERCCYCGATRALEIEHLTPIIRGGRPVLGNLALACRNCNQLKMTMSVEEFRPDRAEAIRRIARLEATAPEDWAGSVRPREPREARQEQSGPDHGID